MQGKKTNFNSSSNSGFFISHKPLILNLTNTHKLYLLSLAFLVLPMTLFFVLLAAPVVDPASATSAQSETRVSVSEVLALKLEKYDPSTGQYIPTNKLEMTGRNGEFISSAARLTAFTNGTGGYRLSISDNDDNNQLNDPISGDAIDPLAGSTTIVDDTDSTSAFPQNRWGYSLEDTARTFLPVPLAETTVDNTTEMTEKTYNFTVATRIGTMLSAGTYQDQVVFTLVGNPSPTSPVFFRTTYMQDFTTQICNTVDTPGKTVTKTSNVNGYDYVSGGTIVPSTIVKDRRDEQEYIVRKLADGNCWMTENLRLGKLGAVALTSENSDLTSGRAFNLPAATTTTGTKWDNQAEFAFVFYRDSNPGAVNPTVKPAEVTPDGPSALYNWYTATAGAKDASGNSLMTAASGQAADSVCPNNWQLPVNGGTTTDKSYGKLVYTYTGATGNSWATTTDNPEQAAINAERIVKLLDAPTSFIYSDYYRYGGTLYSRPVGHYWSSSVASATNSASLDFSTDGANRGLLPQDTGSKGAAFAVRCIVR